MGEIIGLLVLFQEEVHLAWEEAMVECLDVIQLSVTLEDLVNDIDELMIVYLQFELADDDLSFEYSNFVGVWLEIFTVFCGNTPHWRSKHSALFRQLGNRLTGLIHKFSKELKKRQN